MNPNYSNVYYNYGNILQELKEMQKAKTCYEKLLNLEPNYKNDKPFMMILCAYNGLFLKSASEIARACWYAPETGAKKGRFWFLC